MARDSQAALVALNRFGFGARGGASGDFVNAASDPRGFVKSELNRPNGLLLEVPGLQSTPALGAAVFAYQAEVKQAREAAAKAGLSEAAPGAQAGDARADGKTQMRSPSLATAASEIEGKTSEMKSSETAAGAMAANPMPSITPAQPEAAKPPPQPLNVIQKTFRAEALARLQRAVLADCGFAERLVAFWSNHFCISANKGELARMWAGSFEREAIRPHVLGRFADMLKAVEQHPAMLFFLDNQQSIGPGLPRRPEPQARPERESRARDHGTAHARRRRRLYAGRRHLARAHHHRMDRRRAARAGWATPGSFVFNANAHEPGAADAARQELCGRRRRAGRGGARRHRAPPRDGATHRHQIRPSFRRRRAAAGAGRAARRHVHASTDGDLSAVTLALIDSDAAWSAPLTQDPLAATSILVATGRLLARVPRIPAAISAALNTLGQPLWTAAGPERISRHSAAWAASEGHEDCGSISPAQVAAPDAGQRHRSARSAANSLRRPLASPDTRQAIERAETRAAGAGAAADVAGIPEEMTMLMLRGLAPAATSRRALLLGGAGALLAWAYLPRFARAAGGRDPRLVVVILRGALDGLAAVAPIGDPDYAGLHGAIALTLDGPHRGADAGRLLRAASRDAGTSRGCTATSRPRCPCRRRRPIATARISTARTCSKAALPGPGRVQSGWLNRALETLPRGERVGRRGAGGRRRRRRWCFAARRRRARLGAGRAASRPTTTPRCGCSISTPSRSRCWRAALAQGLQTEQGRAGRRHEAEAGRSNGIAAMRQVARGAAKLMAADDGPRIAALAFDGWDTHAKKAARSAVWRNCSAASTARFAEFESGLGRALAGHRRRGRITEFGRTARINGTEGTDHGTGTVVLLAGGAVRGGRVIADWPGLKPAGSMRAAISRRPPICVPSSRPCCTTTSASPSACWRRACFRIAPRRGRCRGCWAEPKRLREPDAPILSLIRSGQPRARCRARFHADGLGSGERRACRVGKRLGGMLASWRGCWPASSFWPFSIPLSC